ncbi:tabersonine 3-oxygenase-like [Papaver somniferum]|uniref:tabersonine 3-oxygenase-like n=1 Tax=Papaver somniferum TaxID=3469 RepID=UPI000E6F87AD|nr:tabersonine 3-oxygenase-like [Papaver somniferum]
MAMSELLQNRIVMEKVQTEVRRAFNGKKHIEEAGLDELEYFKLGIQETLRLHLPSPLTLRESRECCKIDGYDIAAKTKVIINLWAIGRDPDYRSDPDMFEPERFDVYNYMTRGILAASRMISIRQFLDPNNENEKEETTISNQWKSDRKTTQFVARHHLACHAPYQNFLLPLTTKGF